MSRRTDSVTVAMLRQWNLAGPVANPLFAHHILAKMAHFRNYALYMAYITPPNNNESMHNFRKRLYGVTGDMADASKGKTAMRITRKHPGKQWTHVWKNLHNAWIADSQKSTWYVVMHKLIPTNKRLATIQLAETDRCPLCGKTDNVQHRLTQCGEGPVIWNWMRLRLAVITRTDPLLYQRNGRCDRPFISGPIRNRRRYYGYWHTWRTSKHRVNGDYPCTTTRTSSAGPGGKPIND